MYKRLVIGKVPSEVQQLLPPAPGAPSMVPYGDATWLSQGFHSAYYNDSHRRFQRVVRSFMQTVVMPDALACEENGKRASQKVFDALA